MTDTTDNLSPRFWTWLTLGLLTLTAGLLLLPDSADAVAGRKAPSGWVGPYKVVYSDFRNDAGVKALFVTTAPKTIVEDTFIDIDTAFARAGIDGGPSAVTISLGKDGAKTRYESATDVYTGATSPITGGTVREEDRGVRIDAYLLTTGQNAAQLTAGEAKVYVKIAEPANN